MINKALIVVALIAITSAVYSWYKPPKIVNTTQYIEVPKERIVQKIKTVTVPGPERIVTIEKEKIVKVLDLPDGIKKDDNKQVIANAEVHCDDTIKGQSVVVVMDTRSGESSVISKPLPLPFMSLENTREIGARYGLSSVHGQTVDIYGSYSFLRVGNVHLSAYGEVSSNGGILNNGEAKVAVQLGCRW